MATTAIKNAPTRSDVRFHINNTVYGNKAIDTWIRKGKISRENADLIKDYVARRHTEQDLSQGRVNKISFTLLTWSKFVGTFRDTTIEDLFRSLDALKTARQPNGGPYSKNFIYDTVGIIKPFYLWMIEQGIALNLHEKDILKIKRPRRDLMTKTAADILTEDEIKRMVDACFSSRDRAIIMLLYDGGFRIGELGTLTWGQVKFDDYGCVINTDGKTGKPRYVRLIASAPYLATWKQDYPFTPEAGNLVFVSNQNNPITYEAIYKHISRLAERAGIKKKVTPHIFRHTRITDLINKKVPESVIKTMMWGSLTTDMFACYAHLTNENIDNAILEQAGIKKLDNAPKSKVLAPRQCPACYYMNGPTHDYCGKCGTGLTDEARKALEVKTRAIENNPRYEPNIEKIMARMAELEEKVKIMEQVKEGP
jgi:integrase